jgi:hypothetical protein
MKKLKLFLSMSPNNIKMLIEAYLFLGWGRLLKFVPFAKIAPKLGERMNETPFNYLESNRKLLGRISQMIHLASKYTFWESECLVKAFAARKMLQRRGISSTLYLGTGRDEVGKLVAHAWLRSGPFYITGSEGKERFTVVATFANSDISLRRKYDENK